jgi:hypothetical protein
MYLLVARRFGAPLCFCFNKNMVEQEPQSIPRAKMQKDHPVDNLCLPHKDFEPRFRRGRFLR